MICKNCGNKIENDINSFYIINGRGVLTCNNCNKEYTEDDINSKDIDKIYWEEDE